MLTCYWNVFIYWLKKIHLRIPFFNIYCFFLLSLLKQLIKSRYHVREKDISLRYNLFLKIKLLYVKRKGYNKVYNITSNKYMAEWRNTSYFHFGYTPYKVKQQYMLDLSCFALVSQFVSKFKNIKHSKICLRILCDIFVLEPLRPKTLHPKNGNTCGIGVE